VPRRHARIATLSLILAALALPGCYHKVVSAKGFGATAYNVEEPNVPDQRPADSVRIKNSQWQPRTTPTEPPKGSRGW
jgi:hypothetical protein